MYQLKSVESWPKWLTVFTRLCKPVSYHPASYVCRLALCPVISAIAVQWQVGDVTTQTAVLIRTYSWYTCWHVGSCPWELTKRGSLSLSILINGLLSIFWVIRSIKMKQVHCHWRWQPSMSPYHAKTRYLRMEHLYHHFILCTTEPSVLMS